MAHNTATVEPETCAACVTVQPASPSQTVSVLGSKCLPREPGAGTDWRAQPRRGREQVLQLLQRVRARQLAQRGLPPREWQLSFALCPAGLCVLG